MQVIRKGWPGEDGMDKSVGCHSEEVSKQGKSP